MPVRANASEDPRNKLTDEEMISQMSSLTIAGHETTSSTVTWMLFELARHPEYQDKMRAEIAQKRADIAARGDTDFMMDDLESLEYLQAAIKVRFVTSSLVSIHTVIFYHAGNTQIPSHRPIP